MNLRSFDLNLLVVFETLMRLRSATLAAGELSLTQSAVSNALKRLRMAFDDPLFVKTPQGMMPTDRAIQLSAAVSSGLAIIRDAVDAEQAFVPANAERTFRVYSSDIGQMIFMPRLMATLAMEAPSIRVTTVDMSPRDAQAAMAAGEIDLAMGLFASFADGFHQQRLFQERYVAVVREGHPTVRNTLTAEGLLSAAHIVYRPTAGSHDVFEGVMNGWFEKHRRQRNIAARLAHSLGLSSLISQTDLLACVPSRLADALQSRTARMASFPLPFESPVFDICQLWHARYHADPGHQWLRQLIFRLFRNDGDAQHTRVTGDANTPT